MIVFAAVMALVWPAALMLFLAWRDEHNPHGWCAQMIGALDRGLFGHIPHRGDQ